MSLLMDALKKAELAKQQGNLNDDGDKPTLAELPGLPSLSETQLTHAPANEPSSSPPLSLELLDTPPKQEPSVSPSPQLPKLPERMEDLDAQFMESAAPRAGVASAPAKPVQKSPANKSAGNSPTKNPPATSSTPAAPPLKPKTGPDAAKNVFAAKSPQSVLASTNSAKRSKAFAMTLGGLSLLSALSIGAYFWWQLQPKSGLMPMTPMASMPSVAPAPTATPASLAPANASPPAPATQPAIQPLIQPPSAVSPAPTLVAKQAPAVSLPDPDSPVRVTRAPLRVNPLLSKGFDLFERGELSAARQAYEQALKSDPHSIDALQGMAAISLRESRPDAAEHYFQRILLADPQDPHAIAGLANLRGHINPGAAESRLKSLIAAQPELSAPHLALGNLFSTQERWAEAQQAYFKAYSADPGNPDILFNLAVSLEHLRQNKLAAQYYALAIDAATKRPAGFDVAQASARLRALQL